MIAEFNTIGNRWCVKFPLNAELSSPVYDFDLYISPAGPCFACLRAALDTGFLGKSN